MYSRAPTYLLTILVAAANLFTKIDCAGPGWMSALSLPCSGLIGILRHSWHFASLRAGLIFIRAFGAPDW